MTIIESADLVTWAAKVNIAVAILNMANSAVLIYAAIKLRQAAKSLRNHHD